MEQYHSVTGHPKLDKTLTTKLLLLIMRRVSSGKQSDLVHFLKAQVKIIPPFPCTLFYVFLTPKSYELSLLKSFQVPLFHTKDIIKIFI